MNEQEQAKKSYSEILAKQTALAVHQNIMHLPPDEYVEQLMLTVSALLYSFEQMTGIDSELHLEEALNAATCDGDAEHYPQMED